MGACAYNSFGKVLGKGMADPDPDQDRDYARKKLAAESAKAGPARPPGRQPDEAPVAKRGKHGHVF